ncbi:hypothetical protein Tco_0286062 [Tanacetum coccineum]
MLKVSPWKRVIRFGKREKLNPRYIGPFKILAKVRIVAYRVEHPEQLSRVHSTFHVSNLKKCLFEETLAIPLDEIQIDDKLRFIEEPVEIMDREVKRLKQSRSPIVKVQWNSRRGPEFTWEPEAGFDMSTKVNELIVNGLVMPFLVSNVWNCIRPHSEGVPWHDVVWFANCQPDSHSHLLFECGFSSQVWNHMKGLAGLSNVRGGYKEIIDYLIPYAKRRSCKSVIAKLVFSASVYYIWQERNARLFLNQKQNSAQLIEVIKSVVGLKLLSCSFKKTRVGLEFGHVWKLPGTIFINELSRIRSEKCAVAWNCVQLHVILMSLMISDVAVAISKFPTLLSRVPNLCINRNEFLKKRIRCKPNEVANAIEAIAIYESKIRMLTQLYESGRDVRNHDGNNVSNKRKWGGDYGRNSDQQQSKRIEVVRAHANREGNKKAYARNLPYYNKIDNQRITKAMAAYEANQNGNGNPNVNVGGVVPVARECTYQYFLKCQPLNFKGTERVVGLTRYALTWWNSHKRTIRTDAAYAMTWKALIKLMTEVYCPRNEIQKMETEL